MAVSIVTGFSQRASNPGLAVTILAGDAVISGSVVRFPTAAISLPPNALSYIYLNFTAGAIQSSTAGFLTGAWPICTAQTDNANCISISDLRPDAFNGAGGGGGTPGGSNKQVQFNNSSAFGGDSLLLWDTLAHKLTLGPTTNIGYATLEATPFIYAENTNTDTVGGTRGPFTFPYLFYSFLNPASNSAVELFNINGQLAIQLGCSANFTNELCGAHFEGDHNGTGTAAVLIGCAGEAYNLGSGTVTNLAALSADSGSLGDHGPITNVDGVSVTQFLQGVGTIGIASGLHVYAPITGNGGGTGSSTVTKWASLLVENPGNFATSTWGIYVVGGDNYFANSGNFTYVSNLLMNDGASNLPSIRFTSEVGLGIRRAGTSQLSVVVGAVDGFIFDAAFGLTCLSAGDIGISGSNLASRDVNLHRVGAGILGVGNGTYANVSGTFQGNFRTGAGAAVAFLTDGVFGATLYNGATIGFSAGSTVGTRDASISRIAAASLAVGNGTVADFTGTLKLTTLTLQGKVGTYNGIATVSNGVPSEIATIDLTGQVAAIASTLLYTPTASGMFRISAYLKITTAGTSPVLGPLTITFTDGTDSVAQSMVMQLSTQAGASATTNAGNSTTSTLNGEMVIWAKTGVAINYAVALTGTVGTAAYEVHLKCEAM